MALIQPFQGYRYNRNAVRDLNLVVSQPFDKIGAELQQDYYGRSEHNVVRITRNREKNENPDTDYPEAARVWREWIDSGILVQDPAPAIYAYSQEYEIEGERLLQRGFMALLDLRHSAAGILPHERTFAAPKQDRLRLLRSTEANEDAVYMLYTDDKLAVDRILEQKTSHSRPEIQATDDFGAVHRVWSITDAKALKQIQDAMAREELFIADGHHRFETALDFMKECDARKWKAAAVESFDRRLVTCFNSAGQEITILPAHRLVRDLPEFKTRSFLAALGRHFVVRKMHSEEDLRSEMREQGDGHVFGMYMQRRFYLLMLKDEALVDPVMLAYPEAYRNLDVSILHTLILNGILGIDEAKLIAQAHVDYVRSREECVKLVNEGRYQAVFFLNPTSVEQVQRLALLGEKMPQKSTDFYPKLLTGLIFMKMKIHKPAS